MRNNNNGWNDAVGDTGIAPIDSTVKKTLAFEQSHLGNPMVQFALLGFAVYGIYTLATKYLIKGGGAK
tara:strand:- start:300 stop:503 length:204 start_codon:yes stop_codon:yes gene_type:complete